MTTGGGPAMASLRLGTRAAHERIDLEIGRGEWLSTPGAYAGFLTATLRFHRVVEAAVTPAAASIAGLEYEQRCRSPLLENDLATLADEGVLPDADATRSRPPPPLLIAGPGAALGCLYVVEGSTLGGRVLARWIANRFGYDRHRGASGFAADARGTAQRWRAFGEIVEAWIARAPGDLNPMVASAQATFAVHRAFLAPPAPRAQARTA